jgi:hypothetical protein
MYSSRETRRDSMNCGSKRPSHFLEPLPNNAYHPLMHVRMVCKSVCGGGEATAARGEGEGGGVAISRRFCRIHTTGYQRGGEGEERREEGSARALLLSIARRSIASLFQKNMTDRDAEEHVYPPGGRGEREEERVGAGEPRLRTASGNAGRRMRAMSNSCVSTCTFVPGKARLYQ